MITLPTVAEYERAILEVEGNYRVCGRYLASHADAALERRRVAMTWCRDDARRAERIRAQQRGIYAVAN